MLNRCMSWSSSQFRCTFMHIITASARARAIHVYIYSVCKSVKMTPHYTQSNQNHQFKRKSKSHSFDIFQFSFLIISKSTSQSQNNMRKAIEIISPQQDSSTGEAEIRMQAPRLRPRTASDTGHERVCMYICTRRCMYMFSHLLRISVHLCCIFVLLLKSFVGALPIVVTNADASRLRPCISITKSWQEVMAVLTGYALNVDLKPQF